MGIGFSCLLAITLVASIGGTATTLNNSHPELVAGISQGGIEFLESSLVVAAAPRRSAC